jgi:pyruvate/2-oxoglutarate dehydrogenase complex dihydrolipoamide dehydrogenase (E3) component
VLPTVDHELGSLVHAELQRNNVEVLTDTAVTAIARAESGALTVTATRREETITRTADFVLVVVGVRPDTELAADAGAARTARLMALIDRRLWILMVVHWAVSHGKLLWSTSM